MTKAYILEHQCQLSTQQQKKLFEFVLNIRVFNMIRNYLLWRYLIVVMVSLCAYSLNDPAFAQDQNNELNPPTRGQDNNSEMWRAVRQGIQGTVSIPDKKAGVLVQSEGEEWRAIRNGPISKYGVWLTLGTIALLALFFFARGRIRIEKGKSGQSILRFGLLERIVHWTVAGSFIILAITDVCPVVSSKHT